MKTPLSLLPSWIPFHSAGGNITVNKQRCQTDCVHSHSELVPVTDYIYLTVPQKYPTASETCLQRATCSLRWGDCSWLHWSAAKFRSQQCTKHSSVSVSCSGENSARLISFFWHLFSAFFYLSPGEQRRCCVQWQCFVLGVEPSDCGKLGIFQWVSFLHSFRTDWGDGMFVFLLDCFI